MLINLYKQGCDFLVKESSRGGGRYCLGEGIVHGSTIAKGGTEMYTAENDFEYFALRNRPKLCSADCVTEYDYS